jgi:hypothetical protein
MDSIESEEISRGTGDLISHLTKIRGRYIDKWTDTDGYIDRQQGDLISILF